MRQRQMRVMGGYECEDCPGVVSEEILYEPKFLVAITEQRRLPGRKSEGCESLLWLRA